MALSARCRMEKIIGRNKLLKAVTEKKLKLIRILLEGGVDPNLRSFDGKTALIIACCFYRTGDDNDLLDVVRVLLEHNACTNTQDIHGRTALMYALYHTMPDNIICQLLLHGSDPYIRDKRGKDSFSYIPPKSWSKYFDCLRPYMVKGYEHKEDGPKIPLIITEDKRTSPSDSMAKRQNGQVVHKGIALERSIEKASDKRPIELSENIVLPVRKTSCWNESSVLQSVTQEQSSLMESGAVLCQNEIETTTTDQTSLSLENDELLFPLKCKARFSRSLLYPDIPDSVFGRRRSCPISKDVKRSVTPEGISTEHQHKALSNDDIKISTHLRTMNLSISHVDLNILKCTEVKCLPKLPPILKSSQRNSCLPLPCHDKETQ